MKIQELKTVYKINKNCHNRVSETLEKLDECVPNRLEKHRVAFRFVIVCAVVLLIGAITFVGAATDFFGLFTKSVGKYGLDVKVAERPTAKTEKQHVRLRLGYIPNGYKQIGGVNPSDNKQNFSYGGKSVSDRWGFSLFIVDSNGYKLSDNTYITDNEEEIFHGHKIVIAKRQFEVNSKPDYIAIEYFDDYGYVVEGYCEKKSELLRIMRNLSLETDYDYTEPPAKTEPEAGDIKYSLNEDEFRFAGIGEEIPWSEQVISGVDNIDEALKRGDNFIFKVKSIEERDGFDGLNRDNLTVNDSEEYYSRFFDENGKLITPYTRTDWELGDGVNSLDKRWETKDERHFYLVELEVKSNTNTDFRSSGIWASPVTEKNGRLGYSDEYGDVSLIYNSFQEQTVIPKGESRTFTVGIVADDDINDCACITFSTEIRNVDENRGSVDDVEKTTCVKLDGGSYD